MKVSAIEIDARNDLRPSEITGTALRQIRKMLDDLNIRVVSVCFRTRRGYDCIDDLERRIAATQEAMRLAHDLGANVVVNQIGLVSSDLLTEGISDDASVEQRKGLLKQVLSDLSQYGQHIGAILGCETGSEPLCNLVQFIESIPALAIGITLNPGNLLVNGFDLKDLSLATKHVVLVHAKDGVREQSRGRGTEVQLGRGMAEFPDIAAALEEHRYNGYFVVERDQSPNPIQDVSLAVEYLRNI